MWCVTYGVEYIYMSIMTMEHLQSTVNLRIIPYDKDVHF